MIEYNNQTFNHVVMVMSCGRIQYNIDTFTHMVIWIVFHNFDNKADIPRLTKMPCGSLTKHDWENWFQYHQCVIQIFSLTYSVFSQ